MISKVSICNLYDSEHLDVLKKEEEVGVGSGGVGSGGEGVGGSGSLPI